jgi:hypothetical protein
MLLYKIVIFKPIFKERIEDYRLVLFVESDDLLLAECILDPPDIGRRIESVLLYDIRCTELHHAVKDCPEKADLMVCQVVHHAHEARLMERQHALEGIGHYGLVDEALGHEVTDGSQVVDIPQIALEELACAHGKIPVE